MFPAWGSRRAEPPLLVVWPEYPPGMGGMQVHGIEFARFLHARQVPFRVIAQAPRSPGEAAEGEEFDRIQGFAAQRILPRGAELEQTLTLLKNTARSLRPRAVFCSQTAFAPAFADLGVPIVCRSAGNDILRPWFGPCDLSHRTLRKQPYAEQRERLARNRDWVRQAAGSCETILCNSVWTQDQVRSFLGESSHPNLAVALGGVDVTRFRPLDRCTVRREIGWSEDEEVGFIAARHTLKKGIDTAIEATALLRKTRPAFRLIIAGQGTETDNLRALAEEMGVSDRVHFVGSLPHTLMPRYLAAADVALAPSRDVYDPRRFAIDYETMGRMICEAAACSVPIIASRCGGIPEVVHDKKTGLLTRPNDPESVAAALEALLSSPARRVEMGRQARVWAESALCFDKVNTTTLDWLTGKKFL